MTTQYALLSLPSNGSDWFVDCILTAHPELSYFREFFNPITNLPHAGTLAQAFGCELADTIPQLCQPDVTQWDTLDRVYKNTWAGTGLTFTKENYAAFKLRFFCSRFNVMILLREPRDTFPPNRLRVVAWYVALYESLQHNERLYAGSFRAAVRAAAQATTVYQKVEAAHALVTHRLRADAAALNVPVVEYEHLIRLDYRALRCYLSPRVPKGLHPGRIADAVRATRRPIAHEPYGPMRGWNDEGFARSLALEGAA